MLHLYLCYPFHFGLGAICFSVFVFKVFLVKQKKAKKQKKKSAKTVIFNSFGTDLFVVISFHFFEVYYIL